MKYKFYHITSVLTAFKWLSTVGGGREGEKNMTHMKTLSGQTSTSLF
jgi:hypothetical protein